MHKAYVIFVDVVVIVVFVFVVVVTTERASVSYVRTSEVAE